MSDAESLRRVANRVHAAIRDIQQAERLAKIFKALRSVEARPPESYTDEIDSA